MGLSTFVYDLKIWMDISTSEWRSTPQGVSGGTHRAPQPMVPEVGQEVPITSGCGKSRLWLSEMEKG